MSFINSTKKIALVDCNSFYVSCERLFNPKIQFKPVVVLSNNDGCVISRSKEAKNLGIKITYLEQKNPNGLPDAFIIGEKFIGKDNVALILGDNFFYGQSLTEKLQKCTKLKIIWDQIC